MEQHGRVLPDGIEQDRLTELGGDLAEDRDRLRLQALQLRRQWVLRLQRHCGIDGWSAPGVRRYISGGRRQQRFFEGAHRVVTCKFLECTMVWSRIRGPSCRPAARRR